MNTALPANLERFVTQLVESGRFNAPDEVIWTALLVLQDEEERRIRIEELDKEMALGIEQANRGELIDGDEVFAELEEMTRNDTDQSPANSSP
jgi:antitoxin ParD1/3/4